MTTLQAGRRLRRAEFERRWDATPGLKHAELLDSVVRTGCDGRAVPGECRVRIMWALGSYTVAAPSVQGGAHCSVRIDDENELQPTICLLVNRAAGGRTVIDPDGVIGCGPELAADVVTTEPPEVIAARMRAYARTGTPEYLTIRPFEQNLEWFVLRDGRYDPLPPDPVDGLLKSAVFPGLWLDAAAFIRNDLRATQAALARGLASPEHAAFVQRLAAAASP